MTKQGLRIDVVDTSNDYGASLGGERLYEHPILDVSSFGRGKRVSITVDGKTISAYEGETVAAALIASGVHAFRRTAKAGEPRGVFCCIGRCTDCMMVVDGKPNVRTCITPVRDGMVVETQVGLAGKE